MMAQYVALSLGLSPGLWHDDDEFTAIAGDKITLSYAFEGAFRDFLEYGSPVEP
jgi:hypothetical protein